MRSQRTIIALGILSSCLAGAVYAASFTWTECAAPVGHLATVNGLVCADGVVLPANTTQLTSIVATAHCGCGATQDQDGANALLSAVQLWLWRDADGDGQSSAGDDAANPTGWTKVAESYAAVGWDGQAQSLDGGTPGELLSAPLTLPGAAPGRRYLLLLRVVNVSGYTNLMITNGDGTVVGWGAETWTPTGTGAHGVTGRGGLPGISNGAVWYFRIQAGNVNPLPAFPSLPNVIE